MDFVFSFGPVKKIYRLDDQGISVCKEKNGTVTPEKTIAWKNILNAGEGAMTGGKYQMSREVTNKVISTTVGLPPSHSDIEKITGFIIVAYTQDGSQKKKVIALPIDVNGASRNDLVNELDVRLGNKWLGSDGLGEMNKKIGVPMFNQIKSLVVFIVLILAFLAVIYIKYFAN